MKLRQKLFFLLFGIKIAKGESHQDAIGHRKSVLKLQDIVIMMSSNELESDHTIQEIKRESYVVVEIEGIETD